MSIKSLSLKTDKIILNTLRENGKLNTRLLPEPIMHSYKIKRRWNKHDGIRTLHCRFEECRENLSCKVVESFIRLVLW